MAVQLLNALLAVVLAIGVCLLYFVGTNYLLERIFSDKKLLFPQQRPLAQSNPALVIFDSGPVISRCLSCISGL